MKTLKKYWSTLLLFLSATAAVLLYFFRSRPSVDESIPSEIAAKKAALNMEKSQIEEKQKKLEQKVYSDEEIARKYNEPK